MTTWMERGNPPVDIEDFVLRSELDVQYNAIKYNTLEEALADIGLVDKAFLILPPGLTRTLTAGLSIPANVTLDMRMGGIDLAGQVLTINGPIVAGNWQVFTDSVGGGSVVLGRKVGEVLVAWWGVAGDGITDDGPAFQAATAAANGLPVMMPPGVYFIDNSGADLKSPIVHDGTDVHLTCVDGVAILKARFVELPTVSGVPVISSKITRNVLSIENAASVRLENILFDGGDDLVSATTAESDIDQTYRASMLEIRSCERVILNNVRTQRARVVTSPHNHGTGGEDVIETYRSGPVFIRDCGEVTGRNCGFGDDHRGEGWQILNCRNTDIEFESAAPNVWTPINVRGTDSVIKITANIEENDGSAVGVGGQDADITVIFKGRACGGVNLGRYFATDVRGWRTATVEVDGSGLQERSHGFGVKLEPAVLARTWDGAKFVYPYGSLKVRGNVVGALFGVYAAECESVDIDLNVHDAIDASAAHAGAHSTMAGAGVFIQRCGTVQTRGKIKGTQQITVDAVAYSPEYGEIAVDCEHVDFGMIVHGGAFASPRGNTGKCAVSTIDGKTANGDRHFRTLKVGGTLIECIGYFGEAAQKLNSIQFTSDFLRYLDASGDADMPVGTDNLTLNVYQILPSGVTTLEVVGGAGTLSSGVAKKIDFNALGRGFIDDIVAASDRILPRQRGLYIVTGRLRLTALPAGSTVELEIRKNGVTFRAPLHRVVTGASAADTTIGGTVVIPMDGVADYIELWAKQTNGGGTIIVTPDAWLDAIWVPGVY